MDSDLEKIASRVKAIIFGIVLALIAAFGLLCAYAGVANIVAGRTYDWTSILVAMAFTLIAFGFGLLAYRLITGKGPGGRGHLLSATALSSWGHFFGVAGVLMLGDAVSHGQYSSIFSALGSIGMGMAAIYTAKQRKLGQG